MAVPHHRHPPLQADRSPSDRYARSFTRFGTSIQELFRGVWVSAELTIDDSADRSARLLPDDAASATFALRRWEHVRRESPLHFSTNTTLRRLGRPASTPGRLATRPRRAYPCSVPIDLRRLRHAAGLRDLVSDGDWLVRLGLTTRNLRATRRSGISTASCGRDGLPGASQVAWTRQRRTALLLRFAGFRSPRSTGDHGRAAPRAGLCSVSWVCEYDGWPSSESRQRQKDHLRHERLEAAGGGSSS